MGLLELDYRFYQSTYGGSVAETCLLTIPLHFPRLWRRHAAGLGLCRSRVLLNSAGDMSENFVMPNLASLPVLAFSRARIRLACEHKKKEGRLLIQTIKG